MLEGKIKRLEDEMKVIESQINEALSREAIETVKILEYKLSRKERTLKKLRKKNIKTRGGHHD